MNKVKVLIIDDEPTVLKSISKIFQKQKDRYEIATAGNGLRIGYLTVEFGPDVVILDIDLPWIDGYRVCRIIRNLNKDVKVLAITGYNIEESKVNIIDSGADAFLPKPFGYRELVDSVEELISN